MDLSSKLEKTRATLYFLQTCFENSIVPKTFRVNQLPDPRFSETNRKRWFNNIRTLERNNMRLSIEEQKTLEKIIMSQLQTSLNLLENQVSSLEEANILKSRLLERQLMVREREAFIHKRKFYQLVKEEKRTGKFKRKLRFVVCPSPQQQIPVAPVIPLVPSHPPPYPRHPVAPTHNPPPTSQPLVQPNNQPPPSSQILVTLQSPITRLPSPSLPPSPTVSQVNPTTRPPPSFPLPSLSSPPLPQDTTEPKKKKRRRFIKRSKYRARMRRKSRRPKRELVINYSSYDLSSGEESLMNKHLSFVPLPEKINTTQLSYDISRFSRTLRWTEDLKDVPRVEEDVVFKVKKHNLPRKAPSTTLSKFIYGIESDIMKAEPKRIHSNLKDDEHKALKSLVKAQKEGQIVIQRCDKGGATAIMNRDDYVNEIMEQHLQSTVTNQNGDVINVYREVDPLMLNVHHDKLRQLVEQGFQAGFLDEKERVGLIPEKPGEARAYGMPKAHKAVPEGKKIPPVRLVISGCGSTTESASLFVDHHTKHIPTQLPSYIQDTPDFLRLLERENRAGKQNNGAFPVTIDVVGLYPNIPQAEGLIAFENMVSDPVNRDQTLPAGFLVLLLKCVLEYNVFIFDGKYYIQDWGTAIGSRVAPTYACIFMGVLEQIMLQGWTGWVPRIWKRYIDDIFNVWESTETCSVFNLHK
jgi:hypothetical protein